MLQKIIFSFDNNVVSHSNMKKNIYYPNTHIELVKMNEKNRQAGVFLFCVYVCGVCMSGNFSLSTIVKLTLFHFEFGFHMLELLNYHFSYVQILLLNNQSLQYK